MHGSPRLHACVPCTLHVCVPEPQNDCLVSTSDASHDGAMHCVVVGAALHAVVLVAEVHRLQLPFAEPPRIAPSA